MKKILIVVSLFITFSLIGIFADNKQETKIKPKLKPISTTEIVQDGRTNFVYFTGIGCPHCSNVDPILFKETVRNNDVFIIEYEIYQQRQNAPLIMTYNDKYNTGLGVPLLIAGDSHDKAMVGDSPILQNLDNAIDNNRNNLITLADESISFEELDMSKIPGLPNIWYKNRVAIKKNINTLENQTIKDFLIDGIVPNITRKHNSNEVQLSGDKVIFENSIEFSGWVLMF